MQHFFVSGLVLQVLCATALAQEPRLSVPRVTVGEKAQDAKGAFDNILPEANPYRDFLDRLKAAIETNDVAALQALYQTNGVSVEQLSDELSRWRPMLAGDTKSRVTIQTQGTIFRDFSPSNSNPVWKHLAERRTTHKCTNLLELMTSRGYWMLPLVEVGGRLFLVPSDKSREMGLRREDVQPAGAATESQPVPSKTNSTSGPAGSRP